ncbi:MAG: hypothetical protein EOM62_15820, partial [Bacteroidia bacterium]|nr:hypothetical protein [Bacteroidia bacterium]
MTVKNDNYLAVGGDFVATTGTLIYDGLLKDKSALLKIYETFTGDIPALRDHLIGNYAVIIKKENEITIFGEEYYMYDIFWLCKDGKWTISNDMYSIYSNNKDILSINKRNLLEEIYVPGILANETEINDVFRLSGDKKIVINLIAGSLSVEHVKVIWQKEYHNYRETVRNVADNLINVGNA